MTPDNEIFRPHKNVRLPEKSGRLSRHPSLERGKPTVNHRHEFQVTQPTQDELITDLPGSDEEELD